MVLVWELFQVIEFDYNHPASEFLGAHLDSYHMRKVGQLYRCSDEAKGVPSQIENAGIPSILGERVDQIFRLTCGEEKVQREFLRLASDLYRYSDANGFRIYPHAISFRYVAQNVARHVKALAG